jgi:hypothetical protein
MPLEQLQTLVRNLQQFDLATEQNKIIEDNKDVLADLQAEQWASTSKDYAGREIRLLDNAGGGYRPFTIQQKRLFGVGLGRITDRVTNYQTGELFRQMKTNIANGKFFFTSGVPYFKTLMKREGDPTGLDSEQRLKFAESYVQPGIKVVLKEKTGLTF